MSKVIIKLLYRQVIKSDSKNGLEKSIWKASYEEFLLKSQAYNRERTYTNFQQMIDNDGRANSLHYKTGFAVANHIETLQNNMPQLRDSLDRKIAFQTYECRVIESDITKLEVHTIAIHYITDKLVYHGSVSNYMILSKEDGVGNNSTTYAETFMVEMQVNLSVVYYQLL